jgi:MFS transporter, DHA1 family, inner membrane transport protein
MPAAAPPSIDIVAPSRVLPLLVLSQLACTSLWFAVNAVMPDLQREAGLPAAALGTLMSAVQLGFIAGTLTFAVAMIADRFSPRWVFALCAWLGALTNAAVVAAVMWAPHSIDALIALRFATGFLLAGIYPVGMKIAAQWFPRGLGLALGWLLGALVLGTAAPHGLRALGAAWPWQQVVFAISLIAALGAAAMVLFMPEAPRPAGVAKLKPQALTVIWHDKRVRASAFGYFGHMWELYTFFMLVPLMLAARVAGAAVSGWSFVVIAGGALGCALGGWVALKLAARLGQSAGSARVAAAQLFVSGACCLLAPLALVAPLPLFLVWMVVWGITVSGDSPQFSALTGSNAPRDAVGSVLTFVNCIGFAISIVSIQLYIWLLQSYSLAQVLPWLAIGPVVGLVMMRGLLKRHS